MQRAAEKGVVRDKLYRICTEDVNRRQIEALVAKEFDGFTIFTGQGNWKGKKEQSLVVEIAGCRLDRAVRRVADKIRNLNRQEAVLVQVLPNRSYII